MIIRKDSFLRAGHVKLEYKNVLNYENNKTIKGEKMTLEKQGHIAGLKWQIESNLKRIDEMKNEITRLETNNVVFEKGIKTLIEGIK